MPTTTSPKSKCYAVCLGNCNKISGEHFTSRGIFGDGYVMMRGFSFQPEEPIPIDKAVANILCRRHNSLLSPLDSEVKKLGDAFHFFAQSGESTEVNISGPMLELWLLKFFVGFAASGWMGPKTMPNDDIVESMFGARPLPDNVAMYGFENLSREFRQGKSIFFKFSLGRPTGATAFFASINGFPLFLSVALDDPITQIKEAGKLGSYDFPQAAMLYRPERIVERRADGGTFTAVFDWSQPAPDMSGRKPSGDHAAPLNSGTKGD